MPLFRIFGAFFAETAFAGRAGVSREYFLVRQKRLERADEFLNQRKHFIRSFVPVHAKLS